MDLRELERWRENNRLEVKAAQGGLPGDVWPSVSAFANTNGGLIVLGVKENMKTRELRVLGVPNAQKMLEDFTNAANSADKLSYPIFSDGHLHIEAVDGKEVIAIEVPRVGRQHRPVYEGRDPFAGTYRRRFTGDYHCSREEVAAMLRDSSEKSLDLELSEHSKLSDLDAETIHSYRTAYNINHSGGAWTKLDDAQFLCRIGAADELEDGTVAPTRAGVLLPLDDAPAGKSETIDGLPEGLNEKERIAYELAKERGHVTTKALVEAAGVGRQTASNTLKGMAAQGLLVWHGSSANDPSQHYTVQ